ncbi:SAG1386/EF1546 family surface-associated protein [Streptococcus ictaluri]|uniref:LysM domain protein n=1 Tax=Streptococcus ictaluri 707-05 TaxID=764299 RepID=G5K3V1_9STRE|nr:SAG1386/EF1546 family surface-associated protein [Streptococcus ictaluri]EHI69332.1 LysM domain protein [Streptococcus ictaluri 707-05]
MAKEPWEEKIVDDNKETRTRRARSALISTPWLTALLSIFFVIIVAILFIFFYTSNSGSDKQSETTGFYGASTHKKVTKKASPKKSTKSSSSSESEPTEPAKEETQASEPVAGETITVLAGEGVASIAARAGISVEQLQSLNPEHMTQGYWYANPGDEVIIK